MKGPMVDKEQRLSGRSNKGPQPEPRIDLERTIWDKDYRDQVKALLNGRAPLAA